LEALQRARAQKDQRKQASKAQNLESQTAAAQPAQNFVAETPQPAHQAQQGAHEAQQGEHQAQQQEQPQHLQEPPEPQEPEQQAQQAQQPDSRGIFDQGETTDVPPQANPQAVTRASAPSTAAASASMDAHTHPTDGTAGNFCFGVLSLKHYCFVLL
jgi:hypothetical protein